MVYRWRSPWSSLCAYALNVDWCAFSAWPYTHNRGTRIVALCHIPISDGCAMTILVCKNDRSYYMCNWLRCSFHYRTIYRNHCVDAHRWPDHCPWPSLRWCTTAADWMMMCHSMATQLADCQLPFRRQAASPDRRSTGPMANRLFGWYQNLQLMKTIQHATERNENKKNTK